MESSTWRSGFLALLGLVAGTVAAVGGTAQLRLCLTFRRWPDLNLDSTNHGAQKNPK